MKVHLHPGCMRHAGMRAARATENQLSLSPAGKCFWPPHPGTVHDFEQVAAVKPHLLLAQLEGDTATWRDERSIPLVTKKGSSPISQSAMIVMYRCLLHRFPVEAQVLGNLLAAHVLTPLQHTCGKPPAHSLVPSSVHQRDSGPVPFSGDRNVPAAPVPGSRSRGGRYRSSGWVSIRTCY